MWTEGITIKQILEAEETVETDLLSLFVLVVIQF